MKQHNILVTEGDMERLRHLLDPVGRPLSRDQEHLEMLEKELDRARVVSPSQVPEDAVTMNSKVRVKDLDTGNDATYTLVFPRDADIAQGKISVLAPIGTAILGYRFDPHMGDQSALHVRINRLAVNLEQAFEVTRRQHAGGQSGRFRGYNLSFLIGSSYGSMTIE